MNEYATPTPQISIEHLWDHHRGLVHSTCNRRPLMRDHTSGRNLTICLASSQPISTQHIDSGPIHKLVKLSLTMPPTLGRVRPHPLPTDHDTVRDATS